ncbi:MAG: hypothetical protein AB1894_17960 [Chloroflexota bacterium]
MRKKLASWFGFPRKKDKDEKGQADVSRRPLVEPPARPEAGRSDQVSPPGAEKPVDRQPPPARQGPALGEDNEKLERRARRAAESILENESLTAELDDREANVLVEWGVACAKAAARQTAGMEDAQAEQALDANLRATRQLMRQVSKWVSGQAGMDAENRAALLSRIAEQQAAIYGQAFSPPDDRRLQAFMAGLAQPGEPLVTRLRTLFENSDQST